MKRFFKRVRTLSTRIDIAVRKRVIRLGGLSSALYYRLVSPRFSHEFRTMGAGLVEYDRHTHGAKDVYHLRRNVHMLEKGLIMKPRRETFAERYIEETVALFFTVSRAGVLAVDEMTWAHHVLDEYFDATKNSQSNAIRSSASKWDEAGIDRPAARTHGPSIRSVPDVDLPSIDSLTALAHARRSVRWFTNQPVPREIVDRAIEVGMESPTACNRQPYRFLIIEDPDKVRRVAEIPMGTAGFSHQIPALIAVIGDYSAFFDERDRHLIYIDSSLAAAPLLLALQSQGVASCAINWPDLPDRERAMRKELGLPHHEQVVMLIAYGFEDTSERAPFSAKKSVDHAREYA
ncbi:MAG: nitroreductase family protein [Microbacteriaceae bacterium]